MSTWARARAHRAGSYWVSVLLALASVDCRRVETEHERLHRDLDRSSVHVHVGLRAALVGDAESATLNAAVTAIQAYDDRAKRARALAPSPSSSFTTSTLVPPTADEALAITRGLLELRSVGRDLFRSDLDLKLAPLLPRIGGLSDARLDAATDHALALLALTLLTVHPRSPTPLPPQILLYEAWRAPTAAVAEPLRSWTAATKAYAYASNSFCGFALTEADYVAANPVATTSLASSLTALGPVAAHAPEGAALVLLLAALPSLTTLLAHGATASCLRSEGRGAESVGELKRAVTAAVAMGVADEDVAPLLAIVAYDEGNLELARSELAKAQKSTLLTEGEKARLLDLSKRLDDGERGRVDQVMGRVFVATFVGRLAVIALRRSGVEEALKQTSVMQSLERLALVMGPGASQWSNETESRAREASRGALERTRQWVGCAPNP